MPVKVLGVTPNSAPTVTSSTANRQWASRPDDQRYTSLDELQAAVSKRRHESWTVAPATSDLRVLPTANDDLSVSVYDPTHGSRRELTPTNHSFNQLSQYAGAPAKYMRSLPAELAAINLQWGLEHNNARDNALVLAQSNGTNELRAITSTSYGRIWDTDVVSGVIKANNDSGGRWVIPSARYSSNNPKRATTLYASDRDVFIFLVDPKNPIMVPGRDKPLLRGFITWNSEVGDATYGLATFTYDFVCDNRTIWGLSNVAELRIRHTGGAPERFAYEGSKFLAKYAEESDKKIVETIAIAQNSVVPTNPGTGKGVAEWLRSRGFTAGEAKASIETAQAEEGEARTVWQVVQGITAYARSITHTNERTRLEASAGKILESLSA